MKEYQQVAWGIILAVIASVIILGGILLSLAENRIRQESVSTPSQVAFEEEMPTLEFILPVVPTDTAELEKEVTATLTPTLTPLPGCSTQAGWTTIILQNEESSQGIALRYGISMDELAAGNCWDVPLRKLLAGTSLNVPAGEIKISPTAGIWCRPQGEQACVPVLIPSLFPTSTPIRTCQKRTDWIPYSVRSGDTLYSLSRRLGISVNSLQLANCLGNSTVLRTGQILYIPYYLPQPFPTSTPYIYIPPFRTPTPTWWYYPPSYTPGQPPIILPTVGPTLPYHPPSSTPSEGSPQLPPVLPPVIPNPASILPIHPPLTTVVPPIPPAPAWFGPVSPGTGSLWNNPS